ncbi:MAG: translation initiation factor IF-2 [Magnetococcales bacterium]|nr:translation initiation factor IF-2 [Magnetococcales bacterium]
MKDSDGEGEDGDGARLKLKAPRRIVLRKTVEGGSIKQNFSHGRSKSVVVEVRKKKTFVKSAGEEGESLDAVREDQGQARDKSRVGASQVSAAVEPARDRKQQILTPMTPAERQSFQEKQERERLVREKEELERLERERQEAERRRQEAERLEAERQEQQRLEAERREAERREQERLEAERLAAEKARSVPEAPPPPPPPPVVPVAPPTPEPRLVIKPPADKSRATDAKPQGVAASVRIDPSRTSAAASAPQRTETPPQAASHPAPSRTASRETLVRSQVARPAPTPAPVASPAPVVSEEITQAVGVVVNSKEEPAKNLTRAQREDLARKKTEILVAKRLTQLNELREQKRKIDERRSVEAAETPGVAADPAAARETLKSKSKRKGKKSAVTVAPQEKQLPARKTTLGLKPGARRGGGRFEPQAQQPVLRDVIIPEVITVGELASRMAIKSSEVIKRLMAQGMMVTINQVLDQDTAVLVVEELGHRPKTISEGAAIEAELADSNDLDKDLTIRAPVVTIMGHVDHGKTSLLDAIRKTDVAAREFGGITQHIGAYQVTMEDGSSITFLDTPGHAAFTAMRARGAKVTDIVVLVVAADDGVMPQTLEALNHAKAANVPIIVAINKIDRPNANPDRVMQQLADQGLLPEAWGGDSIFLNVSAKAGIGIEALKEMILLQAEVLNLRANFGKKARGFIIEAKLDKGRGAVATCLVANGVLRVGDIFVVGSEWGKIRGLLNDKGMPVLEAPPAMPVEVIGLSGVPAAGDDLITVPDERRAKEIAAFRMRKNKEQELAKQLPTTKLDDLFDQIKQGEMDEVKVVIKADVQGSLEAVSDALLKITHDKIRVNIIHTAVGGITESDVMLAVASQALVVGFNVRADAKARELVKRERADMRFYSVIYDLVDDVTSAMEGKLSPILKEVTLGRAVVRELFRISKVGLVAGCMVLDGLIQKTNHIRLLRDEVVLYVGTIHALKRFKDDVREVRDGTECGISLDRYTDLRVGDVLEAFSREEVKATIG